MNPLLETAGQRATQAGATIKESLLNPLGSYLGKAGKQLSEAYAANVQKHNEAKRYAYGGGQRQDDGEEFEPIHSHSTS